MRLELSAGIRFDRVEQLYHRWSGVPPKLAEATTTLWISAEALAGWPLEESHRRLASRADIDAAAEKTREFFLAHAQPYFEAYGTMGSVAALLNGDPFSASPHSSPPARAFYAVLAAHLVGRHDLEELERANRAALEGIDRGFHLERFDRMVNELNTLG